VKGYGQFCPVAKAAEVIAERWTPLVLRELLSGSHRFNDLRRGVPLMSGSLLSKRLRELEDAGVVERRPSRDDRRTQEYHLTEAGKELGPIIEAIGVWGQRWVVSDVEEDDLDPSLLMWDIRRNLDLEALPDRRVVTRFEFSDVPGARRRWWLLVDEAGADLCMTDPGFAIDLEIRTSLRSLTRYWIGRSEWQELRRCTTFAIDGPKWAQRGLQRWLGRSHLAVVPHAR
jgi:DNA-binding HxlR family transcriptional regulator